MARDQSRLLPASQFRRLVLPVEKLRSLADFLRIAHNSAVVKAIAECSDLSLMRVRVQLAELSAADSRFLS